MTQPLLVIHQIEGQRWLLRPLDSPAWYGVEICDPDSLHLCSIGIWLLSVMSVGGSDGTLKPHRTFRGTFLLCSGLWGPLSKGREEGELSAEERRLVCVGQRVGEDE
jgi:hypothetical protein